MEYLELIFRIPKDEKGTLVFESGEIVFPKNLEVGGDLDLRGTKITKLPDRIEVGGKIYSS